MRNGPHTLQLAQEKEVESMMYLSLMRRRCVLTAVLVVLLGSAVASFGLAQEVRFQATGSFKSYPLLTPVGQSVPLGDVVLTCPQGTRTQGLVSEFAGKRMLAAVIEHTRAGRTYTFQITRGKVFHPGENAAISPKGDTLQVYLPRDLFTELNFQDVRKPFFWPVLAPGRIPITRVWPMIDVDYEDKDHPHQKGLYFMHGAMNGIDFWNERGNFGTIQQTSHEYTGPGPVVRLTTQNDWIGPEGNKFCEDERTYLFWNLNDPRVMDVSITIRASEGPLTIGDSKEGTFGIRLTRWMTVNSGTGHMVSSEGLRDRDVWGKRAAWVDYYGTKEGNTVGIAILEAPGNFRFPTFWHARDYGLFAANPFGIRDFTGNQDDNGSIELKQGETLNLSYRVLVHSGDTEAAGIAAFGNQYRATMPKGGR